MPSSHAVVVKPRFYLLDGLRLCAALAVMLFHYTAREHAYWTQGSPADTFELASQFTAYGALGVQLFFVISGFVILMSAQGRTVGAFISSRVARLFPAYLAGVILTGALITVIAPGTFKNLRVDEWLINLTMTQEAFGARHVDGAYWTLWVELLFYVMIAILLTMRPGEKHFMAFIFLWPLVAGMAQNTKAPFLTELLSPTYAPLFAGGMSIYLIYSNGHSLLRWLLVTYTFALSAWQTSDRWVKGTMSDNVGHELSANVAVLSVAGIFGIVILVTLSPLAFKGPAWLTYAGALTYPVYVIHEYWGWWIIEVLSPVMSKWAVLCLAIAACLAMAAIIERFVERPLRPRIQSALRKDFESLQGKRAKAGV